MRAGVSDRSRLRPPRVAEAAGTEDGGIQGSTPPPVRPAAVGATQSAIYEGSIRHRRFLPRAHAFSYRTALLYIDLDELPEIFARVPFWSARRPALAEFRRSDYLGDPEVPLRDAVADLVASRTGRRPDGPIRVLTHLRYFGYSFNPVTFYYCFSPDDSRVDAVVAEIENTPWGERHAYVLPREDAVDSRSPGSLHRFRFAKQFHVSPFQGMDLTYDWRFLEPGERLVVHMESFASGNRSFDATLALRRTPITRRRLVGLLGRYPFLTTQVIAAIYFQALRLKLKGFRFYPHPAKRGGKAPGSGRRHDDGAGKEVLSS